VSPLFSDAAELEKEGRSFVVVTLLSSRGHAPQDPGAKMLVTLEGLHAGTVGGGKVEAKALLLAQEFLRAGEMLPQTRTWNLQHDVGMTCGGEVTYLFETFLFHSWEICLFGAGHVSQALVPLLLTLKCRLTCIDSRAEWLERLPAESARFRKICSVPMESVFDSRDLDWIRSPETFFVMVTMGHSTDFPILKKLLGCFEPAYYGVIGSPVKAIKIRNELRSLGFAEPLIEKLRCPLGQSIGSNDPAEIAISIAAELLHYRDQIVASRAEVLPAEKDSKSSVSASSPTAKI
jgi:xanthine dehydrogenase accessory factor